MTTPPLLTQKNADPRDGLVFMDDSHRYWAREDRSSWFHRIRLGATSLKGVVTKPFNRNEAAENVVKRSRNPEYMGMSWEEVLWNWEEKREFGSDIHLVLELFLDRHGLELPNLDYSGRYKLLMEIAGEVQRDRHRTPGWERRQLFSMAPEVRGYLQLQAQLEKEDWVPYRVEWKLVSHEDGLGGTADAVYKRTCDGMLAVVDWKRSKADFTRGPYKGSKWLDFPLGQARKNDPSTNLTQTLDTKYHTYGLQVSIYSYILEKYHGVRVSTCFIAQIDQTGRRHTLHWCPVRREAVQALLEFHRGQREGAACVAAWEEGEEVSSDDSFERLLPDEPFLPCPSEKPTTEALPSVEEVPQ